RERIRRHRMGGTPCFERARLRTHETTISGWDLGPRHRTTNLIVAEIENSCHAFQPAGLLSAQKNAPRSKCLAGRIGLSNQTNRGRFRIPLRLACRTASLRWPPLPNPAECLIQQESD